jgi:hypothetical protein
VSEFPLEYVTGAIFLPPFDEFLGGEVLIWITVVNVGSAEGATRAFGFRRSKPQTFTGAEPGVQVFDTDVNPAPGQAAPSSGAVPPGQQWQFSWSVGPGGDFYWFKIETSSASLIPSIEFVRVIPQDNGDNQINAFAYYKPGDFALFHRNIRLFPGVILPEGGLVFE